MNTELVSVIIPTFNRFNYLLNAINSIKNQTYKNIEIIVINDCSTEPEYYKYEWKNKNIKIIHLEKNSKTIFNFPCAGYVRNQGIQIANGKYIAFCDDDDIWFPHKLEIQIQIMKNTNYKMSSTDGLIGNGIYNKNIKYNKYLTEFYHKKIINILKKNNIPIINNEIPNIWNKELIKIQNLIITSSVVIEKEILNKINNMQHLQNGKEDHQCWIKALEHTKCIYIKDICFYYDLGHANGKNY